ncbi:hypothetical protein [Legionella spiritensis]|uniref:hypothetical protein n=1 Tax=Legionella spiritensis TaxID=452 RepID=UPI000F6D518B|nr:hypothetical protein [Legionella spiritensis]VEG89792.1 Uncharacterised protein [Legionella spiritensis]
MQLNKFDLAKSFKEYIDFYNQYYEIKQLFEQHESGQNSLSSSQFDESVSKLGKIRDELRLIKFNVDHRGFFKTGNVKKKLDTIITVEEIETLKSQMKSCREHLEENEENSHYINSNYNS